MLGSRTEHASTQIKHYDVLVLWECEVKGDNTIADRIREFLEC